MNMTITIETKAINQKSSEAISWPLTIDRPIKECSLRDLITSIVREEVASYNNNEQNHDRLIPILTLDKIEEGRVAGRIGFGAKSGKPIVNVENAIKKALAAFLAGHYYVFLDNVQVENLDDEVTVNENSRMVFVRLTPLVGG
jgi:hypothetical protein